jgi:site-specific DNA-methyltransferase (adenine-specific)
MADTIPGKYYERGGVTLYHGDCLGIMPLLDKAGISAIVTDPPYGLKFRGEVWDEEVPGWLDTARGLSDIVAFTTAPLRQWDYPKPDWVLCWYREASNSRSLLRGFNHWSPVLVYGKPKFPVDSLKLHSIQHASPKWIEHPTPKPIALCEWLVKNVSSEDQIVLDPFAGSGSTGVACIHIGRRCILIEKEERYCEIIVKRLEQELGGSK